ncbi:hypothetical protein [Legionella cardiaca]|uniref:Uncharacterized protein n=1 Tax=Legionella cardiaca TaxID=1071983 RepID=A0ABY8ATK2_9GAMM|nr:hypothetical protein [Legionella cardiaca]WED43111.1 hypothetical protein PXX05_14610 [Legionella cardiaca]
MKFFGEERLVRMFTLGGLCSFYQFVYKDIRIFLLGEIHDTMSRELAEKYIKLLNEHISNFQNVTIFLESTKGEEKNNSEHLSFIDSILFLSSPHLTVIPADKRHYNEAFTDLFLFLRNLSELPHSKSSYFDNPKFKDFLKEIAEDYNRTFTFSDLFNLLNLEISRLTQLEKEIEPRNVPIGNYIQSCINNLVKAVILAEALEKECCFATTNEEGKKSDSVLNSCIERMEQTRSFEIIVKWLEIYYLYEIYHFDATLTVDLWQMLHHEKSDNATVIVVSGNTHTEHLANLLKLISTPINSMRPEQKENRISPDALKDLLSNAWPTDKMKAIFKHTDYSI